MQNDAIVNAIPGPEACGSMAELRVAIDALDRALVTLIARRQLYIERAAVLKQDRGAVRDTDRVEDVIAKVLAAAKDAGLSADIAEPVWRALVEASIAHEFATFDKK